jgi:hypothetical protein
VLAIALVWIASMIAMIMIAMIAMLMYAVAI